MGVVDSLTPVPRPSWPLELTPKAYALPLLETATVCDPPHETKEI